MPELGRTCGVCACCLVFGEPPPERCWLSSGVPFTTAKKGEPGPSTYNFNQGFHQSGGRQSPQTVGWNLESSGYATKISRRPASPDRSITPVALQRLLGRGQVRASESALRGYGPGWAQPEREGWLSLLVCVELPQFVSRQGNNGEL